MVLADLGSRIDQALKLAPSSEGWSDTPCTYQHFKVLEAFHHYTTVASVDPTVPKMTAEVLQGDVVRLAFGVCMK